MKLEFDAKFNKANEGIDKLLASLSKRGRVQFNFKKGHVIIEEFPNEKLGDILSIIRENFDVDVLELNDEKKFKTRNDEKELSARKTKIQEEISKNPDSFLAKVQGYIFEEKVFTLTDLRKAFPDNNYATIRAYVNDLKKDKLIVEIERGKYALR